MRLASFLSDSGPSIAAKRDGHWCDISSTATGLPRDMRTLLEMGAESLDRVRDAIDSAMELPNSVRWLPPVTNPEKIICVGLNYADHAQETGAQAGDEPVIFNKFPSTLRAHGDPIVLPPQSDQVDYEAELVVVIGRTAKNVARDEALDYVAGYTCGHDVSARDWQKGKPGKQWLLGKSFDSFAPCGPALVLTDEIPDPANLAIQFRLNGEVLQNSSTSQLIFPVDYLVSYLSSVATLRPGDLLFTGTPAGVGMARNPPRFLQVGDRAEVEIEGIGVLSNQVIAANPA
ncbi:MAG: fumarylacetoacetate hydrolase family protein [Planctomycetales bacterium]|nr:fumarylacetoacetate hydrolase family protein [Planctomycetales bacterium]